MSTLQHYGGSALSLGPLRSRRGWAGASRIVWLLWLLLVLFVLLGMSRAAAPDFAASAALGTLRGCVRNMTTSSSLILAQ